MGADEDQIVSELEQTLEPVPAPLPTAQEIAKQEIKMPRVARWEVFQRRTPRNSSLPALVLVVLVMLLCSGAYTWWQKSRRVLATPESAPSTAQDSAPVKPTEPVRMNPAPAAPDARPQGYGSGDVVGCCPMPAPVSPRRPRKVPRARCIWR